ncbi:DUF1592 domain-containing protein [Verrucomicrobiales bacterium]|nr:DUF1592 domain-containing protein [Verrucomicrobiales bacterium]
MRPFVTFSLVLLCGLAFTFGAGDAFPELADRYESEVGPLVEQHCVSCHDTATQKGDLDLEHFTDLAAIRTTPDIWQRVSEQVTSGEMPPKDEDSMLPEQKAVLLDWVNDYLGAEALANAGDPGPVVLRRLSNAEYTYTLRDLTGLPSLDPANEFPVDSAAGEGFTNIGDALTMSPSLLEKYLAAGKEVAAHAVLLPDGFRFSSKVSRLDWSNELVKEIRGFYRRVMGAEAVDFSYRSQVGNVVPADVREGRLDLLPYFAVLLAHREELSQDPAGVERVAESANLNPHYARNLLRVLLAEPEEGPSLLNELRSLWSSIEQDRPEELVAWVRGWQDRLWTFNPVGHLGGYVHPWQAAINPVIARSDLTHRFTSSGEISVPLQLTSRALGTATVDDEIVWEVPRIVRTGRSPILLRDLEQVSSGFAAFRERTLASLGALLQAAFVARHSDGAVDTKFLADKYEVDSKALHLVLQALGLVGGRAVITGHLTEPHQNVGQKAAISAWRLPDVKDLSVVSNASDQSLNIPGEAPPHSILVHPHPEHWVAAGWQSPIGGTLEIAAHVQGRHGCGNGTKWVIQHQRGDQLRVLREGVISALQKANIKPITEARIEIGDVVSLLIDARDGHHACDLTEIDLVLTESFGDVPRRWSLREDCADSLLAGNPHHDSQGNLATWHFYSGQDQDLPVAWQKVPDGSLLDRWMKTSNSGEASALGMRVQGLVTGDAHRDSLSGPDLAMIDQLEAVDGLLFNRLDFNEWSLPTGTVTEAFGQTFTEEGHLVTAADERIEMELPSVLLDEADFFTTGVLAECSTGRVGVQLAVTDDVKDAPMMVMPGSSAEANLKLAYAAFREVFPAAMCYARVVPIDEVVTLVLYHREDEPLKRLMLDDAGRETIDRLWDELLFVSRDAYRLETALEQLLEFATQDSDPAIFKPMIEPVASGAMALSRRVLETEGAQLNSLLNFAAKAYRRPLSMEEGHGLRGLYHKLRSDGLDHEQAFQLMLARLLAAPAFLYRSEAAPEGVTQGPVTAWEQATRLSYFLWSSMPDPALTEAASLGRLADPEELAAQTRRMLGSFKIRRLAKHFACQWLQVREFDTFNEKNEQLHPDFEHLRGAMYEETLRFFTDLFQENRSVLSILNADHTFANSTLAEFYEFPLVEAGSWQRVKEVRAHGRGGILGMAATLAKHSGASRTSPILRGNWVYETLLGQHLPKPPKGVPTLPDVIEGDFTARQLIEQHTSDPGCAKCHAKVDPLGFALEQYDTVGRLRAERADTKTTLEDGKSLEGLAGLRDYLVEDQRDVFVKQFCRKLLGYALGRAVRLPDSVLLDQMMDSLKANDYRVHVAIERIVRSTQFREIRGEPLAQVKP